MLKWIRFLLLFVLLFVSVLGGMIFTSQNSTPIAIVLLGYELPVLSSGLWLTITLLVGAITGFVLSFIPVIFFNKSNHNKNRKIARLEQELAHLRLSALKG